MYCVLHTMRTERLEFSCWVTRGAQHDRGSWLALTITARLLRNRLDLLGELKSNL